ncbi:MAG: helix-turn-helix transcriptional regulator [Clostridia bacterium]|nr:helix-turn-helix transcriptional regulator [Clostridia bacterium]
MSIKEAKLQYIVDGATELFLKRGIADVTVRDIAVATGVGEATVYRYFTKKQNIVVAAAMKLSGEVFEGYFRLKGDGGLGKLTDFYTVFLRIFEERRDLYKFISEFDMYIAGEKGDLTGYEKALFPFYKNFSEAYDEGLKDGTVKPVSDPSLFYLTTTHALLGLCKKMASEEILEQDRYGKEEISLLISIIVNNLKK